MATLRGLKYPLSYNSSGGLDIAEDRDLILSHILHILETVPSERIMNQSFGLPPQLFNSLVPTIINSYIRNSILNEIGDEVSSLRLKAVDVGESGLYKLRIDYEIDKVPQPPVFFELRG